MSGEPRPFGEVRLILNERAQQRRNPFFPQTDPTVIARALDSAGPAHLAFSPDWIARAQTGEYPFELAETLAAAFGAESYADWVELAPRLSLLDQGVLDRPHAPLLLVNGVKDSVFPVQDMYLLLEHGGPKSARLFTNEGHMGGGQATEVIVRWLVDQLH